MIKTEGIKYTGSKLKLLPYIISIIDKLNVHTVWDAFSGTTRVSQAFAQLGYNIISSDQAIWSKVFGECYLKCPNPHNYYTELFDYLNNLIPVRGWFTEHYGSEKCQEEGGIKAPWQSKNTMKLDAIRTELDNLSLSNIDMNVSLTALMLAMDKVDNTVGHYVSYLKKWSKRSFNDMELKIPSYIIYPENKHIVLHDDIFNLLDNYSSDIIYLDPPYGSNNEKMPSSRVRYNSYYHIWKTICLNDKPEVFGKANRRIDSKDNIALSVFEEYKKDENNHFIAVEAIRSLIKKANSQYILLSYSSGGRATFEELLDILNTEGFLLNIYEIDYKKNVMANMKWTNEWTNTASNNHKEFMFLLKK